MTASEGAGPEMSTEARVLPRGVRACRLLEERRNVADQLRSLIDRLAEPHLLAVAGEQWLLGQLNGQLTQARAALDELAAGTSGIDLAAVERLEQPLNGAVWSVAADAVTSMEQRCLDQDAALRILNEDFDTLRLWFDRYRRELTLAIDSGVPVSAEDREMLSEGGARMREADAGAKQGRFDMVAVALSAMRLALEKRNLWDAATFEEHIATLAAGRVEVDQRAAVMAHRSELILIAASHARPGTASSGALAAQIEYGVLLRRPSFEAAQESNLHDTMRIDADDRRQFQATLDEAANSALAGVRSATDVDPATADATPTRGITSAGRRAVNEHPAERLERIGRLMYSLLIPDAMQRLLDETPCPLTVSSNDLELPWELMHDGNDFLCLKRPFARMPVGKTYPRRTRRMVPSTRTTWNMLLIHSDPDGNLGDSAIEIAEIQKTLNQLPPPVQVKATVLEGEQATGENLTRHLSSGHYDLIHYAGHAGFDLARPNQSYLLLHGKQRFSAERIQRVLEGRPIIFLNACDTSRTNNENENENDSSGTVAPAQGLASAFIYGGAQACVGALWPIFDDSARALAVSFYTGLLARQPVGEALCNARASNRAQHSDKLTWAAYALYGDPRYRLREGVPASHVPAVIDTTT
jgi:CHAT domain-containing protein